MGRNDVVLQVSALSVDGRITADGTTTDVWANEPDGERDQWMTDSLSQASVHVMGATTYRSMAAYWPGSDEIFAEPMNRIPKAVFSRSMQGADARWGPVQVCAGETRGELERLRSEGDGPVFAHGGIRFMRSLAQLDAVDEYRLVIGPWLGGSGDQLFQGVLEPRRLALTGLTRFPSGTCAATYRRAQG
jgi:dihydrofolate reductase